MTERVHFRGAGLSAVEQLHRNLPSDLQMEAGGGHGPFLVVRRIRLVVISVAGLIGQHFDYGVNISVSTISHPLDIPPC